MIAVSRSPALALFGALVGCTGIIGSGGDGTSVAPSARPADGVTLDRVAVYQGLERNLIEDGAKIAGVPVVAGRDAHLRVFYSTDDGYDGKPVTGRLTLREYAGGSGGGGELSEPTAEETIDVEATLGTASDQVDVASTLNFDVPGTLITPATHFRVEVLRPFEESTGTNTKAAFPSASPQPLEARSVGKSVRVLLIPVRYDADGSKRLPDTSKEQLQLFRDTLWKMYPTPEIEIRVGDPFPWSGAITRNGQGWGELLDAMAKGRQNFGAEFDEYLYGIFDANDTFEQFCGGGCITGLSLVGSGPGDAYTRTSIGVGFTGLASTETAVHEIGHAHGRLHAPCGTGGGLDPTFPHKDGSIGAWGFDLLTKSLIDPKTPDYMSYCGPKWTSDFTYSALIERIAAVNGAMGHWTTPGGAPTAKTFERVALGLDGNPTWLDPLPFAQPPSGTPETVRLEGVHGSVDVTGQFYAYSHLPGGVIVFEAPWRASRARVRNRVAIR